MELNIDNLEFNIGNLEFYVATEKNTSVTLHFSVSQILPLSYRTSLLSFVSSDERNGKLMFLILIKIFPFICVLKRLIHIFW